MNSLERAASNNMTKSTASTDDTDAKNALNEQLLEQVPEEFRPLAQEFQRQSTFYQQLIQETTKTGSPDIQTGLWEIPNSHGLSGHDRLDLENPWFESLFTLSNNSDPFGSKVLEQWSQALQSFTINAQEEVSAFQTASQNLSKLHQQVGEKAQALFQASLTDLDKKDPDQLSQAWLAAGEKAFKEVSAGNDFLESQTALINALSHLKSLQSNLANRFSSTFGLPDQNELVALRQGLHDLRIDFAEYREQATQEINTLKQKLNQSTAPKRRPKPKS